jgi:hypothetical protein
MKLLFGFHVTDIFFAAAPITLSYKLHRTLRESIAIGAVLAVGQFAVVASAV